MIKNYRNALLAAAVASFAVGCDGGDEADNLLNVDDPVANLTGMDNDLSRDTMRAIANLIGGVLGQVTEGSGSIFETFDVLSSDTTSIGKLLSSGEVDSAESTPSGVSTDLSAVCSGSDDADAGNFTMDILLAPVVNGDIQNTTPDIDDIFGAMAKDDIAIALNLTFDACNEPKHEYDGNTGTSPTADAGTRILDGNIVINMKSDKDLADAGNDNDFELLGKIEMNNYFVQNDVNVAPDVTTGEIAIAMATDNASDGPYNVNLDFDVTSNDGENGGYVTTSILTDGTVDMDSKFSIKGYDLSLSGDLKSTKSVSTGAYSIYTIENVTLSGGDGKNLQPTGGMFGVTEVAKDYTHIAKVISTGIEFTIQKDAAGTTEVKACTWDEINEKDGQVCEL